MRLFPKNHLLHCPLAVQRLLGLLAVTMMLFGQSLAVGAVQNTSGPWIEICAGSGTKLVQLDGEAPAKNCSHCEYCTVQFSAATAGAPASTLIGPSLRFTRVEHSLGNAVFVLRAEQYWAANRGPPLASEENMKNYSAQRAAMTIPAQRGASWL